MPKLVDIIGQRYGRLVVVKLNRTSRRAYWECLCDCGNCAIVRADCLVRGNTTSCGCYRHQVAVKHGYAHKREYRIWRGAKCRCFNPNDPAYPYYGGRGIMMHPDWRHDFMAFLNHMGPCPPGMSLNRIDTNGNYEPGNCRWATGLEQANNARSNILVMVKGHPMTLAQACRYYQIPYGTAHTRIWKGQKPEAVIESILAKRSANG